MRLADQRQRRALERSAAPACPDLVESLVKRGSLAHFDDAVADRGALGHRAAPVVGDLELQLASVQRSLTVARATPACLIVFVNLPCMVR